MQALALLNQGKLEEAVESAKDTVRNEPGNLFAREVLIELLCLRGEWDRADKQAEAILVQAPQLAVSISLLRQLIRGEKARRECWFEGRVPEFIGEVDEVSKQALLAVVANRDGRLGEALELVTQVEENSASLQGTCNGNAFTGIRDLDDLCLTHFEVITSTGKYFWIPISRIESLDFKAVERPRDLYWRQCHMIVDDGPDGVVYVPAIYIHTDQQA
ncbi:MAG: hypothetical protein KDB03_26290, partial [Planctomycetales bacterium]|nr:hypothetical protein [Planctomycetales bacterium]